MPTGSFQLPAVYKASGELGVGRGNMTKGAGQEGYESWGEAGEGGNCRSGSGQAAGVKLAAIGSHGGCVNRRGHGLSVRKSILGQERMVTWPNPECPHL